jgi:hypothetical protein
MNRASAQSAIDDRRSERVATNRHGLVLNEVVVELAARVGARGELNDVATRGRVDGGLNQPTARPPRFPCPSPWARRTKWSERGRER